jgi:electron transfer flavoprotein alpha subunit
MSRIIVVCEQSAGALHPMSLEALAAGQSLGGQLGLPVIACLFGSELAPSASRLAGYALDSVICLEHEALSVYTPDGAVAAVAALVREINPQAVLFPHTYQVRDFAPALAAACGRPLVSDVTAIRAGQGGKLIFERLLFQGKLRGEYSVSKPPPVFASIQAGSYRAESLTPGAAPVETRAAAIEPASIRQTAEPPFREAARAVDLSAAERIVAAGRGIQEEGALRMIEELARLLGAEVGASRPICDSGWLPMERQVGSSGQTVAPRLYLALGISGAIQHIVGMKGSKTIVAVNKDANAPIFEVADYGIVGDLFEVVPALIEELKRTGAAR